MSASQLSGFSLLFCKKKTKPSTQNRSTNQNAGDHKVSANFHVFLGCGWPRLSAHHSWMVEENNYKEGQHRLHDLIWVLRVITRALCHGGNLLCRNYSRCNFKGSREFRRGRLRSSTQKKTLFFAFVELMRERERETKPKKWALFCFYSCLVVIKWLIQESKVHCIFITARWNPLLPRWNRCRASECQAETARSLCCLC